MTDFEFDLEEMVVFGGREIPLRKALVEYVQAKKQAGASALTGPLCFRQLGKKPARLEAAHLEKIIASISPDGTAPGGRDPAPS
jgi:hypothetical protein